MIFGKKVLNFNNGFNGVYRFGQNICILFSVIIPFGQNKNKIIDFRESSYVTVGAHHRVT